MVASDNGDGGGKAAMLSATQSFVLSVHSPNEPPHLDLIGDRVAVIGQTMTIPDSGERPRSGPTDLHALGLPAGATLTPGTTYGTANVSWAPTAADAGVYGVTFQVADSGNGDPALDRHRPADDSYRGPGQQPGADACAARRARSSPKDRPWSSISRPPIPTAIHSLSRPPTSRRAQASIDRRVFSLGHPTSSRRAPTQGSHSPSRTATSRPRSLSPSRSPTQTRPR